MNKLFAVALIVVALFVAAYKLTSCGGACLCGCPETPCCCSK